MRAIAGAPQPRRPGLDEALAVASVYLRSRRAAIPEIPPPVHTDEETYDWFAEVVIPEMEVWVLDHGGRIVALLVLRPGFVDQLYVHPDHTGRGLGTVLLELAKERFPAGLDLRTFATNHGARRFYERHGFVALGTSDGDNEEGVPDVHYHWPRTNPPEQSRHPAFLQPPTTAP